MVPQLCAHLVKGHLVVVEAGTLVVGGIVVEGSTHVALGVSRGTTLPAAGRSVEAFPLPATTEEKGNVRLFFSNLRLYILR